MSAQEEITASNAGLEENGSVELPQESSAAASTVEDTASMSTNEAPDNAIPPGSWKGWAELENDPVIFGTLLREWGVPGIQVNEVVPLDSVFEYPPEHVYGLIFLFRWVAAETENEVTEAPAGVWFANQTASFSCATIALMNIINNHSAVNLGQALNDFRASTMSMTPKERGVAVDNLDHVRDVHNSFARELDKMNVDSRLKENFVEAEKKKKAAKAKRPHKKRREEEEIEEDDAGFHFVAYVPAAGSVWRMDGIERLPRKLGDLNDGDNWIATVIPELQAQLESAGDDALEYSLLSLTAMTDSAGLEEEQAKVERVREDWGPFLAQMVRTYAEKGLLKELLV